MHWFRQWLGADQATSHYLNQWWLIYWRIYASLGLNELIPMLHLQDNDFTCFYSYISPIVLYIYALMRWYWKPYMAHKIVIVSKDWTKHATNVHYFGPPLNIKTIFPCIVISVGNPYTGKTAGPWFNIKMSSYQYRKSHCGDKTILRPSDLHNGISYTGKTTSIYWIRAQLHVEAAPERYHFDLVINTLCAIAKYSIAYVSDPRLTHWLLDILIYIYCFNGSVQKRPGVVMMNENVILLMSGFPS